MTQSPMPAQAVADLVGGRLAGPGDVLLRRVRSLERAEFDSLAICGAARYADAMARSKAGAVVVPDALATLPGPATRIIVANPAEAIYLATCALHPADPRAPAVAATARIGHDSTLGDGASIGPHCVIGNRVRIGSRAQLGAHVVIGDDVTIGDDVRLDPHVTIYTDVSIGDRVWCKASAVIGGPGFGFVSDASGHRRIPQVGGCTIEDDVEIGSQTCIDRGSLDDTVIGRGTKIDNMVQIGHNVHVGSDCLIMGCVGIAGSTHLGDRVILAGGSGLAGHLRIGDDARIGARALVMSNVPAGGVFSGHPARPHREYLRAVATTYQLAPHRKALEALAREREDV